MKIVYLIDQFYKHGGIEKILGQKLNYLANNTDFEVLLITINQDKKKFVYPLQSNITHFDLDMHYAADKSYYHPSNWTILIHHFLKLKKLFNDLQPDVVVSVQFFPDQYFLPFMKISKTVKEIHFMGEAINSGLNTLDKFLFRKIIPRYSHLVLLNRDEVQFYENFSNIEIIPNFIDEKSENSLYKTKKEKIILAAGRLAPVKQFDHLIKAFALIADRYQEWSVEIYGNENGTSALELNEIIQKSNLHKQVFVHDATNDIDKNMAKSSIFALTSKSECFPMVLLEAKQAGLPIVSYDCKYGPRNIISNYNDGLLVENQSIEDFANKLEILMNDEALRNKMGVAGKQNVALFTQLNIMPLWLRLFNKS